MAKASTRFRNRKINFKTRLPVRTGSAVSAFEEDDGFEGEVEFEEDKNGNRKGLETGVDKEEEGEVHLQAVLASSSASVSATRSGGHPSSRNPGGSTIISTAPRPKAFIPTPDSTGTIDADLFRRLYPSAMYVDPSSYIKFSDTVEEAQIGAIGYTMDEEDEDWLEAYNATVSASTAATSTVRPLQPSPSATTPSSPVSGPTAAVNAADGTPASGRSRVRKGDKSKGGSDSKGKEVASGPISDDEFEEIMELFERVTEEKAPMAHVVSPSHLHLLSSLLLSAVGSVVLRSSR